MSETTSSPVPPAHPPRKAVALVVAVSLAAFLPSLWNGFVYDDHRFVERNEHIRSLTNSVRFLTDPTTIVPGGDDSWRGIYRPIRTFTFALDYAIWAGDATGYHLQNMLWHAIATAAFLWVLVRLGLGTREAVFAVLIFAVHPVQAESVVWITSRGDVFAGALVLITLAIYLGGPPTPGRLAAVGVVFALALLGKESAAVLAPLIVLIDLLVRRPDRGSGTPWSALRRHALVVWVPLFAIVGLYLFLRNDRMDSADPSATFGHLIDHWGGSYPAQLVLAARGFLVDVSALLFPVGNRLDYYPPTDPAFDVTALVAMLIALAMLVLAWRWRRGRALASLGLLWFLVARAPTSNVFVTVSILSADRFLYLPLAGLALTVVTVLPPRARSWLVVPLVLLSVLSFQAARSYEDEATLWKHSAPGSPRHMRYTFAVDAYDIYEQWDRGEREEAIARIPETIELGERSIVRWNEIIPNSGLPDTNLDLGGLYRLNGDRVEAYRNLKKAQGANRKLARISYLMALLFRDLGEYERGVAELERAAELGFAADIDEDIADMLALQAGQELRRDRYARAAALLVRSLDLVPTNRQAAETVERIAAEKRAFRSSPDPDLLDFEAWFRRAKQAGAFGMPEVAIDILSKLRRRAPRNVLIANALAQWGFEELGNLERARELYREVLSLDPDNVEAREGLLRLDPIWYDATWKDPRPPEERIAFLDGLDESDGRVLVMRAIALLELERRDEAVELLERAAAGKGPGTLPAVHRLWELGVRERGEELDE